MPHQQVDGRRYRQTQCNRRKKESACHWRIAWRADSRVADDGPNCPSGLGWPSFYADSDTGHLITILGYHGTEDCSRVVIRNFKYVGSLSNFSAQAYRCPANRRCDKPNGPRLRYCARSYRVCGSGNRAN
jgi:hypothetical protein